MFCISFSVSISRYKDSDYSNITNNYPQKFNNYSNKMHNLLYNPSFCQFQMTQNYSPTTLSVSLISNKKSAESTRPLRRIYNSSVCYFTIMTLPSLIIMPLASLATRPCRS